jgi:hypothetical protein
MLRQGLRSEAIQLAEIEPNLLDLLATLDFPEREQIAGLLERQGHVLPMLYTEAAAELNEAYAAQQPLETLLGRHRYLALAGGPLKDRLAVLRKIAEADPLTPVWNDDVAAYEAERIKEIQGEANRALAARDAQTLETLVAEMQESPWINLPPKPFTQKLAKARDDVRRAAAYDELRRLENELNLAHASLDAAAGRALREEWNAASAVCRPAAEDAVVQSAAPALEWLAMQDAREAGEKAFQQSVADLERAFDGPAPQGLGQRAHLESLYHGALRHGFDLPPTLENRYRLRIEHLDLTATRRTRLKVAAAAVVLIVVGGGIALGVTQQIHRRQVEATVTALAALVERAKQDPSRYEEVETHFARLAETKPKVFEEAGVQSLVAAFRTEVAQENSRAAAFRTAMERAQRLGAQEPDRGALEEAAAKARLDDEKAAVARFEAEIADAERAMQSQADEAFARDVGKFMDRVQQLEKAGFGDLVKLASQISLLEAERDGLSGKHPKVSAPASFQMQPVVKRLLAIKTTMERLRAENAGLAAITGAVGRQDTFLAALTKFSNDHPNGGRADDFKKVIAEAAQWSMIETWNAEEQASRGKYLSGLSGDASKEIPEQLRAAAKPLERLPHSGVLFARADLLQGISARVDDTGVPVLVSLENSFSNSLLKNLWQLTIKGSGEKYFLTEELTLGSSESQQFSYVDDYAGTKRGAVKPLKTIDKVVKAPHCAMSAEVLAEVVRLKTAPPEAWEPGIAAMIRAIFKAEEAEPVLRLALLKRIVDLGCQGSLALQESLTLERQLLENTETNLLVNWMKPGDSDASLAATSAAQEWKKFDKLPARAAAAEAAATALRAKAGQSAQYAWVGWLLNEADGGWRCATPSGAPLSTEGTLLVMTPDVAAGPLLQPIGTLKKGAVEWNSEDRTLFVEGRPIWLEKLNGAR